MPERRGKMTGIDLDIAGLHKSYAAGLTPAEVIAAVYARITAAADPGIFIALVDHAKALAAAEALPPFDPAAFPLWGVPFAVKDNIDVFAMQTTVACPDYAYVAKETAPVVQCLLDAGALLIGKTNLDQFATGLVGVRTPYPVPRNACDPALVPGGSSSGSAVAVARGIVTFALGTDTAGSGRVPAALNNIVGLKPSRGALSVRGVVPACQTLDCVSIFALTTDDAWRVMRVTAVRDPADPWSREFSLGSPVAPPVVRFGIPDRASRILASGEAEAAYDAALALLPGHAAEIDLGPFFAAAALLYDGAWVAERYAAIRDFIEVKPESLLPVTRKIIEGATHLSAADAFDGIYRLADLASVTRDVWNEIDVLVVPSIPDVCTLDDVAQDPIGANSRLGTYTNFVNLLDLAALSVPGPFRPDGRPAGVTLIAPAGRDALLVAVAEALHAGARVPLGATGKPLPAPPVRAAEPPAGTIGLAVVGAHLSGMALNCELTERGATFVKAVATEPSYRLYALPGGPPRRPGLVRVGNGGAAIAIEVWALSPEAFGAFIAAVPTPLCIGTLGLADGTSVKGFLCEAAGAEGAEDITRFGGWRGYVASLETA
jgi:allophanate hydrolase